MQRLSERGRECLRRSFPLLGERRRKQEVGRGEVHSNLHPVGMQVSSSEAESREGREGRGTSYRGVECRAARGRLRRPQGLMEAVMTITGDSLSLGNGPNSVSLLGQPLAGRLGDRLQSAVVGPAVNHVPFSWKSASHLLVAAQV